MNKEENAVIGMYIIDSEYKVVNLNKETAEMYPNVKINDFCYQSIALRDTPCEKCPLKEGTVTFYNPVRKEWIHASAAQLEYPDCGICNSIHFRRYSGSSAAPALAEAEKDKGNAGGLQEQNRNFLKNGLPTQDILHHMPGGYHCCAFAEDFPFLYFGKTFEVITGWTKDEIETIFDNKFINMVYPEDIQICKNIAYNVEKNGYSNDIYRIKKKGGGFLWVSDSTLRVDVGVDTFYHGILANITDYVEAMDRQRQMAEAVPSGYHRVGTGDGFPLLFASDSFSEIVGWTKEELKEELDNKFINVVAPEDRERFMSMEPDLVRDGRVDAVYRILRKDGTYRWVQDATVRVEHGGEAFYQCTLADITAHVEELSAAKEKAEASSRAKTNFLSQMSHDIRTPMNAIVGFTAFAQQTDDMELIQKEYLPKIETASNHLLMLINDVLEMSRIENGQVVIQKEPCNVEEKLKELLSVMQMQTDEKDITLAADVQIKDRYVICDINRVNRVFMNLMSNAVKFTPAGGRISVSILQTKEAENGYASYEMQVADTGIGMSPEFVQKVFEPFEREASSTASGMEGTGLGMSIVKNIVDAINGDISVKSEQGKGTTFTIQAMFQLATEEMIDEMERRSGKITEHTAAPEEVIQHFTGKRALLVEDNAFNRLIAETMLTSMGFLVEQAENGSVAVEMLQRTAADHYDVILMDIQMPIMDGYEATKAIREMKIVTPILAMTANAFAEDKEKCLAVGMNGHISKPIDAEILLETLFEELF